MLLRDLVAQNKKIEFLMLLGSFNSSLCCVEILKDKTLYVRGTACLTYLILAKQLK